MEDLESILGRTLVILDDDKKMVDILEAFFTEQGFTVVAFTESIDALKYLKREQVDLIITDYMMPKINGLSFAKLVRAFCQTPILMLTSVDDVLERVVALEAGVDDYVTKPFNIRTLLARTKVLLKLSQRRAFLDSIEGQRAKQHCQFSGWQFNIISQQLLSPQGVDISLSTTEFELLKLLVMHPGTILTREEILKLTCGFVDHSAMRRVDVSIARLRQKLEGHVKKEGQLIRTVRNQGYLFTPQIVWHQ